MSAQRRIAVILGVGPGLSASIAKTLSSTHSILLLSRSLPSSLPSLNLPSSIPSSNILAVSCDGSSASLKSAFEKLKETWPEGKVDVGVYNVNEKFEMKGFLEKSEDDLRRSLEAGVVGAWNLSSILLPLFLSNSPDSTSGARGVLLFTGATMALRGGAVFSNIASGMFARRALSQSLAREFGPQGVHVSHVIVDGMIDTERVKGIMGGSDTEGKRMKPDDIAESYKFLVEQKRSAWTQELDLRPDVEKW
ncbi:hypothetical protein CI109_105999 [Kwoniella shandongensis]|uniref:Uncharacterized protein n=1 Tax=Kwoniella shandongensis TaxID=1734106 RepID=A0A5M6BXZ6_9TREE|nr:uncharacterized protein CI109_003953 [Kwoniella shandongensis]KAA5527694.1 hypothetical protein CI109_003953 [Kwoniella shandongensis]